MSAQQARLDVLEGTLSRARTRLGTLDRRIATQTARLTRLRGEYRAALGRLELRVRELYMSDRPDLIAFVLGTASFTDLIDNLELLGRIGRQDKRIAAQVKGARDGVREARRQTRLARREAARLEAAADAAATEQRGVVIRLVASRDALVAAEQAKSATLASIEDGQADVHAEIEALEDRSAELAAQIRQSQQESSSSTPPIPPPSGNGILGWPVSGAVVERLRHARGPDARGDRHHGVDEHARPRVRRRYGSSTPAGSAATATSSSSTTAAGSRPRTRTTRPSRSRSGRRCRPAR